jgi:competence protein ComEC
MDIAALPQAQAARPSFARAFALRDRVDAFLYAEREQLPLWGVVFVGAGIAAWLLLPDARGWVGFLSGAAGLAMVGAAGRSGRIGQAALWIGLAAMLGTALIWRRSDVVAAPRVARPVVVTLDARVERAEILTAREVLRLTLAPLDPALPPRLRVSLRDVDVPPGLGAGAVVRLKARLTPPMAMAVPGGHDFARDAWFAGIGGTGRVLGKPQVLRPAVTGGLDGVRERLDRHIRSRLPPSEGGIATSLVTGDQGQLPEADAEAMRRSGLAHLLSVSGLHIAAAVAAFYLLTLRLLALSERLALRFNLVLVAAAAGALAGVGYTLLTGAQVPTVRSCVAALLVLAGTAMGRDAMSLRLIATGALLVMLFRPEAVAGASFQLSFAAVTAIVAVHSLAWTKRHFERREEGMFARLARSVGAMLLTGLTVELALMPLALYHFHRSGVYGVLANMVAIPLTTFVIMPLEALALLLDPIGLGGWLWAGTRWSLAALLSIAHLAADARGSVVVTPTMSRWAFGAMVVGGLWLCLWNGRARFAGLAPLALGAVMATASPRPDLLVTGDGRHLAVIGDDGRPALLRERAGDFVQSVMGEAAGHDGEVRFLDDLPGATCGRDACVVVVQRGGRSWQILATRSMQHLEWEDLIAACAAADVVVSERRLPRACAPHWGRLDGTVLRHTGAVALRLRDRVAIDTVADRIGAHPWAQPVLDGWTGPKPTTVRRQRAWWKDR